MGDPFQAIEQLIKDYEDVPDASDTNGQAVFAEAHAAIARLRAQLTKEKADADSLRAELAEIGGDQRLSAELANARLMAASQLAEWIERHPYGEVDLDMAIEAETKDLKLRIDALESAQIDYEAQCAAKDAQIADAQQDCADARSLLRETEEELTATALDLKAANAHIAELEAREQNHIEVANRRLARAERAEAEQDAMREALKEFERLLSVGICTTDAWRNARDKARAAINPSPAGREG